MSDQIVNSVNIYVESGDAQKQMESLEARNTSLQKSFEDLNAKRAQADLDRQAGNKQAEASYQSLGEQIVKLQKQMTANNEAITIQSKKLSGELSPSIVELQKAMNNLIAVQKRSSEQDPGYKERAAQIKQYQEALDHTRNSAGLVAQRLKESTHESKGFLDSLKEIAAGFTLAGVIERSAEAIKEFFSESIKEVFAMKEGQDQLRNSLESVGRVDALERLNAQAEEYSKKFSYLYTPEITKVQEKLVTFGRLSMNQINEVLPVIINFSAKTKVSMEEATKTILSAMEGNGRALKQFGLEIVKDGGFVQNYGLVMNQLAKRVDGAAEVFDKSGRGSLARYTKQMKELQEAVGGIAMDSFVGITETVSRIIGQFRSLITVQEDENAVMARQRAGMNENLTALQDTNLSAGARKKLIQETNEQYGEYLPHLITEKTTLAEIKEIQNESNKAFQMKIYMMAYQKEIQALLESQLQAQEALYKSEAEHAKLNSPSSTSPLSGSQIEAVNKVSEGLRKVNENIVKGTDSSVAAVKEKYASMLKSLGASWEEFQRMMNEGDKHDNNKSLRTDQGPDKKTREKIDKEQRAWEEFYKSVQEQDEEARKKQMEADAREVEAVQYKFEQELAKLKEFLEKGTITRAQHDQTAAQLEKQYRDEMNGLRDAQRKKALEKAYANELKNQERIFAASREMQQKALADGEITQREYQKRIDVIDLAELQAKKEVAEQYSQADKKAHEDSLSYAIQAKAQEDKILQDQKKAAQQVMDFIRKEKKLALQAEGKDFSDSSKEKLEQLAEQYEKEYELYKDNAEAMAALNEAYAAQAAKIVQDEWQKTVKQIGEGIQKVGSAISSIMNSINGIKKNHDALALAADKKVLNAQVKQYDEALAQKRISQAQHDKLVEAAQLAYAKKEDEMKRKAFERDKEMKIISATINTAAGVMNALATAPTIIAGIVLAALVAALGVAEIAEIASQKYVSSFEQGTESFSMKGVMGGRRHSSGGNPVYDGNGNKIAEVEEGEAIIPRSATANNPGLIRALLTSGRHTNISEMMRPALNVNSGRAVSNISNAAHPGEGGNGMDTSHMERLLHETKQIHEQTLAIHTQALEVHKATLAKPVLSLPKIHETEYKHSVILKKNL